jgi:hypothetical protein
MSSPTTTVTGIKTTQTASDMQMSKVRLINRLTGDSSGVLWLVNTV